MLDTVGFLGRNDTRMLLQSLEIKNYRSLEHVKLDNLQQFNVLIGRNNAGKSSVFQALYDLNGIYYGRRLSPEILTDRDNSRAFEVILTFQFNQKEREHFVQLLIDTGFDAQRRRAILESPFLQEVQFAFKAINGNPGLMHLRETKTLAEDGKWAHIQQLTGNVTQSNPNHAYVVIGQASKDAADNPFSANLLNIGQTRHQLQVGISYQQLFNESWSSDQATRWIFTQLGKYLSEAFFFHPFRHSNTPIMDVSQTATLAQDGSNLAQVLHTLRSGEEETFETIEKFIQDALPDIGTLRTPLLTNSSQTNVVFRPTGKSFSIPLTGMGGGVEQLLMIATVLLMPQTQKSTLFLEEPESHLHAGAQRYLIERLYNGEGQVFISTHSPTFVNLNRPHSLYQVQNHQGRTTITPRDSQTLDVVLEDIGARNSDVLLSDAVLFVEGISDRDVLLTFSETLKKSLAERNINIVPMGGGRYAATGAPIRSDLLKDISQKSPVPHLFLLDRDERREEAIASLEKKLAGRVHVFQARELENYLLNARSILAALQLKHPTDKPILEKLAATSEEEIDGLIKSAADELYSTVLIKRIRSRIGGLQDGLVPTNVLPQLTLQATSEDLSMNVLQAIRAAFDSHIESLDMKAIVASEKDRLDNTWCNPQNRLQIAPGEEILTRVFGSFGSKYRKSTDALLIAKEMAANDVDPEIVEVIDKIRNLIPS